ncbi:MAG: hypothetical protein IJ379_05195 [Lachnospiraceae bacterium]|nr:hypothetical protein [Lachnospiraceae bacterium]
MKYPCLVDKRLCKTPISAKLDREGYGNFGEPLESITFSGLCNYQDRAKTVLTSEKKLVEITGSAYIPGDICPELSVISGGIVEIFGAEREIAAGTKARNPDGTVNYTLLELK